MARAKRESFFQRYLRTSQGPWHSLLFVLPLVVVYETASRGFLGVSPTGPADQLVAFSLLRRGFDAMGATGALLPSLTLIACLLGWHIARQDRWSIRPGCLAGMTLEGVALSLPIVGAAIAMSQWLPCAAGDVGPSGRMAVLAVGAAIYEELLFRLLAFAAIHFLVVDVVGIGRRTGDIVTVFGSGMLFAAYHYLGVEPFAWPSFVFRSLAGAFLGAIFLARGFGVTACCHAAYDLIWVSFFWQNRLM